MIGSFLVLAGLGIHKDIKEIFPLCSLLCLFMYLRIRYYHQSIARISAYMIVFLERDTPIKWETRNHIIFSDKYNNDEEFKNKISEKAICKNGWLGYIESLSFQLISIFLWLITCCKDRNQKLCFDLRANLFCKNHKLGNLILKGHLFHKSATLDTKIEVTILFVCFFIGLALVCYDRRYHNGQKGDWIEHWRGYSNLFSEPNHDEDAFIFETKAVPSGSAQNEKDNK